MKNTEKPLSYFTNRISIGMICIFYAISCVVVFKYEQHREIITSLLIALSGAVGLLVITIASPNKQIKWVDKIINRKK